MNTYTPITPSPEQSPSENPIIAKRRDVLRLAGPFIEASVTNMQSLYPPVVTAAMGAFAVKQPEQTPTAITPAAEAAFDQMMGRTILDEPKNQADMASDARNYLDSLQQPNVDTKDDYGLAA